MRELTPQPLTDPTAAHVWQSADPILGKYLPNAPTRAKERVELISPTAQNPIAHFDLLGVGGVYNPVNLGMYGHAGLNPVKYADPDGNVFIHMELAKRNPDMGRVERYEFYEKSVAVALGAQVAAPLAVAAGPKIGTAAVATAAATGRAVVATGRTVAKHSGDIAEIAGLVTALSGAPSDPRSPNLPADSPLDPKTSVQQVTKDVNRPKLPGIIGKILSLVLPVALTVEPPKPPAPVQESK